MLQRLLTLCQGLTLLLLAGCGDSAPTVAPLSPEAEQEEPVQAEERPAELVGSPLVSGVERVVLASEESLPAPVAMQSVRVRVRLNERVPRGIGVRVEVGATSSNGEEWGVLFGAALMALPVEGEQALTFEVELPREVKGVWARLCAPGYAEVRSRGRIKAPGEDVLVHLSIREGGTLRGIARLEDGAPPAQFSVLVGSFSGSHIATTVEGDGRFEVHLNGTGIKQVMVNARSQGAGAVTFESCDASAMPKDLEVTVRGAGSFAGRLLDQDGKGLSGLTVIATDEHWVGSFERKTSVKRYGRASSTGRTGGSIETGRDGSFEILGLRPGEFVLMTRSDSSPNFERLHEGTLETGCDPLTFHLERQRLGIRVRDAEGTFQGFDPRPHVRRRSTPRSSLFFDLLRPSSGPRPAIACAPDELRVMLVASPGQPDLPISALRWLDTGDPTRWEVSLPRQHGFLLSADSIDHPTSTRSLELGQEDTRRDVILELAPKQSAGRLQLTIADPAGTSCVRGYGLRVVPVLGPSLVEGREVSRGDLDPEQDLLVTLELPPGRYRIVAQPIHTSSGSCFFDAETWSVVVPGAAEAWVDVLAGANQQLTMSTIAWGAFELRSTLQTSWEAVLRTVPAGVKLQNEYDSWQVPPGTYKLEVTLDDGTLHRQTVQIRATQTNLLYLTPSGLQTKTPPEYEGFPF